MSELVIYPDDLVVGRSSNGKYKFAVVENVAGIEDSDESSDSELEDFPKVTLDKGFVRVVWYPEGRSEILQETSLQLVDRSCLPRDVVRKDIGDQLGTVISGKVVCDVGVVGTSKTLKGLDTSKLIRFTQFQEESWVTYEGSLGRVREPYLSLILRFSNGSRGKLDMENCSCSHLIDFYPHPSDQTDYFIEEPFYPGQYLFGTSKAFQDIEWISGTPIQFKAKLKYRVLVEQIGLEKLNVKWVKFKEIFSKKILDKHKDICSELSNETEGATAGDTADKDSVRKEKIPNDIEVDVPEAPRDICGKELKKVQSLDHFWFCHVCLGQRYLYQLTEKDAEDLNKQKNKTMKKNKRMKLATRSANQHGRVSSSLSRKRKTQAVHAQNDSASSSSGNDDSAYDEEEIDDLAATEGQSALEPSSGACGSVLVKEKSKPEEDIEVVVNSESDINISSPSGKPPTILGVLACRVSGFELEFFLIQENVNGKLKLKFQCNIQNPECSKAVLEKISGRFLHFLKSLLKKNKYLVEPGSGLAIMSKCPLAIRKFILEQPFIVCQEITFEYEADGKRTSGIINEAGEMSEIEYLMEDSKEESDHHNVESVDQSNQNDFKDLTVCPPCKRQAGPNVRYHAGQYISVEITRTTSTVDVQWQDGSIEKDLSTLNLLPAHHVDDNDFCPGDFVVSAAKNFSYGMVLTADSTSRMTKIQWFYKGKPADIEEVSAYDVADYETLHFRISDIVVRYRSYIGEKRSEFTDTQVIGEILNIKESGLLDVLWSDGTRTEIHHLDVLAIESEEEDSSLFDTSDEDEFPSEGSWITASSGSTSSLVGDSEKDDGDGPDLNQDAGGDEDDNQVLEESLDSSRIMRKDDANNNLDDKRKEEELGDEVAGEPVASISSSNTISSNNSESNESSHSSFTVIPSVPVTHHFILRDSISTQVKTFMKALSRDIRLLQTSLSPGITVKAYEDRMDLLSVLIEGPERTPYQDGLFAFDVYLPQQYPSLPPSVHYISYSPRLNPNLYEMGRVCVSLLGTWSGRGSEKWTKDSTLLQVLLSIQGLILNSEPYYNEAGYEGHRGSSEGKKNSRCYNEMVILRLVQHMCVLVQKPFSPFEEEVKTFCAEHIPMLLKRSREFITMTKNLDKNDESIESGSADIQDLDSKYGFPLLPLSRGVIMSLETRLNELESIANRGCIINET